MSTLDLSLDTLDLHLASIESADLNSLPTSIFAPTELPAWSKVDLPTNTSKIVEPEPIFLEDFKWDGLEHLLSSKPVVHDSGNTRVSVFERFDLGKITDDELSLFGEGGNNRFSFYVGKVSPLKVNALPLAKPTAAPAPISTASSKTLSQMTQGKENQSASANTVPRKSESPKQPEVSRSTAMVKKPTKSSTPTRNSLSGLPSGLPASTAAKNSPRHSISRIPSSSSPSINSAAKKQVPAEKTTATVKPTTAAQPPATTQTTTTIAANAALKKPATVPASNIPARTISPTPSTQTQPTQPTPPNNTGIPVPSVNNLKKPVKKSSDIPKAASIPQKTQTAPTQAPTQAAPSQPAVPSQPLLDPVAQLLARVKILEDTITTMKKEHKQEVSALRTRLTLVEQKLQATSE